MAESACLIFFAKTSQGASMSFVSLWACLLFQQSAAAAKEGALSTRSHCHCSLEGFDQMPLFLVSLVWRWH